MLLESQSFLLRDLFVFLEQQAPGLPFVLLPLPSELDVGYPVGKLLLDELHSSAKSHIVIEYLIFVVFLN